MQEMTRFALATAPLIFCFVLANGSQGAEQSQHKPALSHSPQHIRLAQEAPRPTEEDKRREEEKQRQEEIKRLMGDLVPALGGKPAPSGAQTPGPPDPVKPSSAVGTIAAPTGGIRGLPPSGVVTTTEAAITGAAVTTVPAQVPAATPPPVTPPPSAQPPRR